MLKSTIDKSEWVGKERLRWAKLFNVPMAEGIPPGFPANTIKVRIQRTPLMVKLILRQVQRVLTVVAIRHPERLADTLAAIYHASFAEQKEVHTPESLMPIFQKMFGKEETEEIVAKAGIEFARMHVLKLITVMLVVNK